MIQAIAQLLQVFVSGSTVIAHTGHSGVNHHLVIVNYRKIPTVIPLKKSHNDVIDPDFRLSRFDQGQKIFLTIASCGRREFLGKFSFGWQHIDLIRYFVRLSIKVTGKCQFPEILTVSARHDEYYISFIQGFFAFDLGNARNRAAMLMSVAMHIHGHHRQQGDRGLFDKIALFIGQADEYFIEAYA